MLGCALDWKEGGGCPPGPVTPWCPRERQDPRPGPASSSIPLSGCWLLWVWFVDSRVWVSTLAFSWLSSCNLHVCLEGPISPLQLIVQMQTLVRKGALQVTSLETGRCMGRESRGHFFLTELWQGGPRLCLNAPSSGEIPPFCAAHFTSLEFCKGCSLPTSYN